MPEPDDDAAGTTLSSIIGTVADLPVAVVLDRVVLDRDGHVEDVITEYVNGEAADLFGLSGTVDAGGRLGRSITETLPAKAAAESLEVADQVWATGRTARGVWQLEGPRPMDLVFTRVRMEPCYLLGYFELQSSIALSQEERGNALPGLAEALDASPDSFLILDESRSRPHAPTVTVDFVNRAAQSLVPELTVGAVLDPASPFGRVAADLLNQARGIDAVVSGEWTARLSGRSTTLALSTKPLGDGRRVITFRDVTIKQKLREEAADAAAEAQSSRAMLFAALDSLPMPVGVCDAITSGNGTPEFVMRFRNSEALRRSTNSWPGASIPVEQALPGLVSAGLLDVMVEVLRTGEPARHHVRLEREAVGAVDYDMVVSRVSPSSVILIGFDVTEDRQIRQDLAAARDQALTYAEGSRQFFSTLTHELRTPLTTVVGACELLLGTALDGDQRGLAERQHVAAQHLLSVINDSLDLRALGERSALLQDSDFVVADAVASVAAITTPLAAERGTTVAFTLGDGVPPVMRGDGFRLERALMNLVSNAVKFSPGGHVAVRVDTEHVRGNEWELWVEVEDDGIGIDPEALEDVFLPFHQASASTRRTYGGSGLGLALVRQTVTRMNGRVWAESQPGHGSTFRFTVRLHTPLDPPAEGGGQDEPVPVEPFTSARVLLVEDEDVNRTLVTALLEREGLVVDAVDNGLDAVASAMTGIYDLVFMDVRMPVVSGFEATRRIRRTLPAEQLPIVALTASPTPDVEAEAAAAGMQATLGKPIDVARLMSVVRGLIAGQGAEVPARP